MLARQKTATPQPAKDRLIGLVAAALRNHDDERRQVVVHAAQAVTEPRAEARPARLLATGLYVRRRRVVVDRFGVQRFDDCDLIHDLRRVRQQFAYPRAALAMLGKLKHWRDARE